MNRPQYILLPVSRLFIAISLIVAFMLNLLPWGRWLGVPDFVALVLVFWSIHQPRKVGIGVAFFMGLLMDVHDATLLGENALAYTLLSYFAIMIHRRVLWFPMVHPGAACAAAAVAGAGGAAADPPDGRPAAFRAGCISSKALIAVALWPLATWMLLAPQRRAVDRDDNRPLNPL